MCPDWCPTNLKCHQLMLEDQLKALKCHFTWNLQEKQGDNAAIEEKLNSQMEFLVTDNKYMVYNLMAYIKHVQGDYTKAMVMLEEAEELCLLNSNQSPAKLLVIYGNYAWLYYKLNEYEKSQLYVEKVENIYQELKQSTDPKLFNCPEIYGEQGWTLLKYSGHYYEQAKECFEKALESAPEDPEWNTGYAIAVHRLEYLPNYKCSDHRSLDLLKRATELNPKDSEVKTLLGLKLQELRREVEGLKYIEEALAQTPNHPSCLRYAAKFYRKARMIDEALHILKRAVSLQPKSSFIHHQIGQCYRNKIIYGITDRQNSQLSTEERNKFIQKAIFHFELTLEFNNSFTYAYVDLANMYKEAKEYTKAEEKFNEVLAFQNLIGEDMQQIHHHFGKFAEFCKKSESKAIHHYKEALLIPISTQDRMKCEKRLEIIAKRKLEKNPRDSIALGLLGLVYKVQENISSAIEYYEKALNFRQNPKNIQT
uniref:Interferon-induced protein with tetratricopeptide repeats 5 n=1 Tax=Leptobrachium leishanense TaxID=445787 RepID=A0A8C5N0H9_9ANUR